MTVADRLEEIGEERQAKKTALKMLEENLDVTIISKVTELSIDEIKQLEAENQEDFDSKE